MLTLKRLWRIVKKEKYYLIFSVFFLACGVLLGLINPYIIKTVIDSVLDSEPITNDFIANIVTKLGDVDHIRSNLWIAGAVIGFVAVLTIIMTFSREKLKATFSENIAQNLKDTLYEHLLKLPYDYHVKAQTGDLIQRCTSDVETVRRFLGVQLIMLIRSVILLILAISLMLTIHVKLTISAVVITPFIFIFSYVFFTKIKSSFQKSDEKEGEMSAVLQENLSGIRVVRAFGRQRYEIDKFGEKNFELRNLNKRVIQLMAFYWSFSDIMIYIQVAIVLFYSIYLAFNNEITVGTLIMFLNYEWMLMWPIRQMGRILSDLGKMQVSLGRIYEILDTEEEKDTEGAIKPSLEGDIEFDNVKFKYDDKSEVLNGLSFKVKKGETIAILGATGSGKSTLMHILLRLYDYQEGSIKINGVELKNIEKHWLRSNVGIVLQDPFLYSRTIEENLKMAKDEISVDEMVSASEVAAIHEVIEKFEKGYETMVGEKGVTLSGGQKQRVAIARTLIKNSAILIFDDSLSAVDTETDRQIRNEIQRRSSDITTFIISQRITTLMDADRIFVLENGKLSESGTHEELISREGLYKRIWNIQSMLEDDFEDDLSESGMLGGKGELK